MAATHIPTARLNPSAMISWVKAHQVVNNKDDRAASVWVGPKVLMMRDGSHLVVSERAGGVMRDKCPGDTGRPLLFASRRSPVLSSLSLVKLSLTVPRFVAQVYHFRLSAMTRGGH